MIAISPEFSPVLPTSSSSSSSSWHDDSAVALVNRVKSEEVCHLYMLLRSAHYSYYII